MKSRIQLAGGIFVMVYGSIAHGQSVISQPGPSAAPRLLQQDIVEIVVTAERHKETVQSAALAITAISGEQSQQQGRTTVATVLEDTPSVIIQNTPQGGQIFIRGVGANGDSNWVDPAVSLNIDGVYTGRSEEVLSSTFDVNRIEVLRGPQGTLYGRNATGGAVNVVNNVPAREFGGMVNLQGGNYDLRHVDGAINIPLSDVFSVRVAGERELREGYFSNNGRASDISGYRVKALYRPTDRISILASVDDLTNTGNGATTVPRSYNNMVPPFVNWPTNYSDPWQVDPVHPADIQKIHFRTYYVQGDFDLGFGVLTVLPALTQSQRAVTTNLIVGTAVPGAIAASTWEEKQKTLEVRLASPDTSSTKWVVGLYGYKSENNESGTAAQTTAASYETNDVQVPATSYAAFGQVTYPVANALRVTGGLRYTKDKKTYQYVVQSIIGPFDSGLLHTAASYSAVTYKLGAEYDLAADSLLYGSVATGYKAGGFSTTAIPPVAYDPEHLTAVELGSKNRFLDHRLLVNGSIYHYSYKNYQVQYPLFNAPSPNQDDPPGTTVFAQYVVNAKTGTNQGAELETRYFVTPHTTVRAAFNYIDAHYGDMKTAALSYLNGTPVINTPKFSETLGFDQEFHVYNGHLTLAAQIRWYGGYRIALDKGLPGGDLNLYQDAYHKSDAHLTYVPDENHWSVTLWARNLENEAQLSQALPFGRVQITDPRTVGLNVNTKF